MKWIFKTEHPNQIPVGSIRERIEWESHAKGRGKSTTRKGWGEKESRKDRV
jgi:hypothetical protein